MDTGLQPSGADHELPTGLASLAHHLRVERKNFTFDVRENPRGKFLRITEEVNGRYDTIIVPITGLEQFRDTLDAVIKVARSSGK